MDLLSPNIFDIIIYITRKDTPMIATALALQDATQQAVHDEDVMNHAAHIFHSRNEMDNDEFVKALFQYSAHLASMTTTLVTHVLLTETQLDEMIDTIKEMEEMGKDNDNGNN
jgi:hypothetical protein